jgi:hypothetical protein
MAVENLKPESAEMGPANALEEGQHILANIIARAYLRTRKEGQAEFQPDCKTKDKEVKNHESVSRAGRNKSHGRSLHQSP